MSSVSGFWFAASAQAAGRPRNGHTGQPDRMDQASNMALQAMGVDSSKAASITKQIEAAMQAAAKNSDGSSDPRAAAQRAVSDILTKNGIDPQQFKTQIQAAMKKLGGKGRPAAKPAGGGQPPSGQAATSKQATSSQSTAQEEAAETYADTLKEALAGDQQAIAKLAAEQQAADNGAAADTTQGNASGVNMTT